MPLEMNRPLDEDRYQSGKLALRAKDLNGANSALLTITGVDEAAFTDPDAREGKRYVLVLHSREFPEKGFFLNATSRTIVIERFGNVPSRWVGKVLPIVVDIQTNPKTNKEGETLRAANADEWDDVIEASGGTRRRGRPSSNAKKKTARRR